MFQCPQFLCPHSPLIWLRLLKSVAMFQCKKFIGFTYMGTLRKFPFFTSLWNGCIQLMFSPKKQAWVHCQRAWTVTNERASHNNVRYEIEKVRIKIKKFSDHTPIKKKKERRVYAPPCAIENFQNEKKIGENREKPPNYVLALRAVEFSSWPVGTRQDWHRHSRKGRSWESVALRKKLFLCYALLLSPYSWQLTPGRQLILLLEVFPD